MKHGYILILIFLGVGIMTCSCNEEGGTNANLQTILQAHKTDQWDMDVSKLSRLSENPKEFMNRMAGTIEVHEVRAPANIPDAFRYNIILSKDGQQFWILRTGGFAGVYELYGTGVVQTDGTIKYLKPKAAPDKK